MIDRLALTGALGRYRTKHSRRRIGRLLAEGLCIGAIGVAIVVAFLGIVL